MTNASWFVTFSIYLNITILQTTKSKEVVCLSDTIFNSKKVEVFAERQGLFS